jgi:hypothetical protein
VTRVVIVAPRDATNPSGLRRTADALDLAAAAGYEVVGVVDPVNFREAHGLVADDVADVILVAVAGGLPSVVMAADVRNSGHRAEQGGPVPPHRRRPQPIPRTD